MVYGAGGCFASSSRPTQQVSDREEWRSGPDLIIGLDFGIKTLQTDFVAFHRVVAKIFLWDKLYLKSAVLISG